MRALSVSEPYRESTASCSSLIALLEYAWIDVNRTNSCAAFLLSMCIATLHDGMTIGKPTIRNDGASATTRH